MEAAALLKPQRPLLRHRSHSAAAHYTSNDPTPATRAQTEEPQKPSKHRFLDGKHPHLPSLKRTGEVAANTKAHISNKLHDKAGETLSRVGTNIESAVRSETDNSPRLMETEPSKISEKQVTTRDLELERKRDRARNRELRKVVDALTSTATASASKADSIFLFIVEKTRTLKSTLDKLEEISNSSFELHTTFKHEAESLRSEISAQLDAFHDFEEQQQTVRTFENRLEDAKKSTTKLDGRLEAARRRVEMWEAREREWQAKTSKRLTFSWVVGLIMIVLVAFLIAGRRLYWSKTQLAVPGIHSKGSLPSFIVEDLAKYHENKQSSTSMATTTTSIAADDRLRKLDEL